MNSQLITDSRFYMWRTLFSLVHVDGVITPEEVRFMSEALEDVPFTDQQKEILLKDSRQAQDPEDMFQHVMDVHDQATFFALARNVVHVDGDYGEEEQEIMLKLQRLHVQKKNVDELIGSISLSLEDDSQTSIGAENPLDEKMLKKFKGFFFTK